MAPKPTAPTKPLREVAFTLVAKREHTAAELRSKLRNKGYLLSDIELLVAELKERNYVNDARAAGLLAVRRAKGSKWGKGKIAQELAAKGVDKALAQESLSALEAGRDGEGGHDWLTTATGLLRAKYKAPLPTERAARQKEQARRMGFLLRRGFSTQQALQAMKTVGVAPDLDAE